MTPSEAQLMACQAVHHTMVSICDMPYEDKVARCCGCALCRSLLAVATGCSNTPAPHQRVSTAAATRSPRAVLEVLRCNTSAGSVAKVAADELRVYALQILRCCKLRARLQKV